MKLCDTCIYRNNVEQLKPCIIYRDNCEYYEKERGDMTDDAISRQAVLDRKYVVEVKNMWHMTEEIEVVNVDDIKALPPVKPQEPKWIPVSERLPEEEGKSVLVYAPEYNNIYCAYLESDTWFIFGSYGTYAVANVIAWMPLPEPYEPQESEDKG